MIILVNYKIMLIFSFLFSFVCSRIVGVRIERAYFMDLSVNVAGADERSLTMRKFIFLKFWSVAVFIDD